MTDKPSLRTETERLLIRLNRELGYDNSYEHNIPQLSDYDLLKYINVRLINLNCVQLTDEELYRQLTTIKPEQRIKGEYSNKQWN